MRESLAGFLRAVPVASMACSSMLQTPPAYGFVYCFCQLRKLKDSDSVGRMMPLWFKNSMKALAAIPPQE